MAMRSAVIGLALALLTAGAATAQDSPSGQVARSLAGRAGQRQALEQVLPPVEPMARLDSRIQNRVQSRIRNRIDPGYDPVADATSPFAVAGEQARIAGRIRRR